MTNLKNCPKCGSEITYEEATICHNCGKKLVQSENQIQSQHAQSGSKQVVQEYKRTCRMCGKVWHSLVSREKGLGTQQACYGCQMCANIGSGSGSFEQTTHNFDTIKQEADRLKMCPQCGSTNYSEEILNYDK
jgi:RNA polymerase subunit RPABC4/transcription elongation factor Spt4